MAKQTINQGTAPTGAGGDTFRTGSAKLQANDDEIYNYLGDGTNLNKLGTAAFKNTGTQAGNVMEVGAFGLGENAVYVTNDTLLSALRKGFITIGNQPAIVYGQQYGASYNGILRLPTAGQSEISVSRIHIADGTIGQNTDRIIVKTTANTQVDPNGFIKAASPIVSLYADKIELNDEAKQQSITFEKLGVGDYLVKGSSGFAQEGWYIETPKDANGNVLFSVIYKTLENGDISIKTYKKKFDFETVSIVADLDNPVDITEGRWIDLRLQELPQPEPEEIEPIAPPNFQPTGLAEAVATVMESYNDTE